MHPIFKELLEAHTPRINPIIANGLACARVPLGEQYIHEVFIEASRSFPPGLEYVNYERCTPLEEFYEETRPRNNRRSYDLARNDLRLMKYTFRFNGEPIIRYMYLPWVRDAGRIHLGGACYQIIPVLSDIVISAGKNSVFVRYLRDKQTFKRFLYNLNVNDTIVTDQVTWSSIHYERNKGSKKVPATTKALTCAVHYLLGKYGFSEMFRRYLGFVPVIGGLEITEAQYPRDQWVICQSSRIKPKTYIGDFYEPSTVRLAVPIEHWSRNAQTYITGFYYVVDHFPNRVDPKYVDNPNLWLILLGHIIFSGKFGEGKLHEKMSEHYASIDEYVDMIIANKLKLLGYDIRSFYDLLALIIQNISEFIIQSSETSMSMYNKTLDVDYYVFYPITKCIFDFIFLLGQKLSKKTAKGEILARIDIVDVMNKTLRPSSIHGIKSKPIGIATVGYSGDNRYIGLTSTIAEQEARPVHAKTKQRTIVDETKRLHPSAVECGSILFLSKSTPSPNTRINPFIRNFNPETCAIGPDPSCQSIIDDVGNRLKKLEE